MKKNWLSTIIVMLAVLLAAGTMEAYSQTAQSPDPANGAKGIAVDYTLAWTAPADPQIDPAYAVTYAVYADPNMTNVQNGLNCDYSRTFTADTAFPLADMSFSKLYYWRVDTKLKLTGQQDPNTFTGPVWNFQTAAANQVDAGSSIVTWLKNGQTVVDLAARTTPAAVINLVNSPAVAWSVIGSAYPGLPAPPVAFSDTALLNPAVTITAAGSYTLKVTANDGINPATQDLVQVRVYDDACLAAKNNPNTPYVRSTSDYDNDCDVDMKDLETFAKQWLIDSYPDALIEFAVGTLGDRDILLWIDASDASTLTIDGANQLTRWNDKSGSGKYLVAGGTAGNPDYLAAELAGKGVVDFGPFYSTSGTSGKWMQFKNADGTDYKPGTIRTAFWVIKGANHLLGDDQTYMFHRGGDTSAAAEIWGSSTSLNVRNGKTYLNGASINGTTTPLPETYSLVSLVTAGSVEASRISGDRSVRSGGQQIAEILIFNRPLIDSERQAVEAYLTAKWFPAQ